MCADRLPAGQCLNPYDPSHMAPLVAAMSRVECGVKPHYEPDKRRLVALYGDELTLSNLTFKSINAYEQNCLEHLA